MERSHSRQQADRAGKRARKAAEEVRRAEDEVRRAQELMRKLDEEVHQHPRPRFEVRGPVAQAGRAVVDAERSDGVDAVAALDELTTEMCQCTDQACVDAVSVRINAWGRDLAPQVPWGRPVVLKRIAELSQRNIVCAARITGQ